LLVFAGIMAVFIGDRFNAKKVDPNPVDAAAKPITAQFVAGTKLDSQIPAEYPTGVWIPLLKQEPWSVIIHAEDKVTFRPGELVIDAEYQVLMRLGETTAPNYSLRVTMEPDSWDADAGLFFGMQPMVARPNSDLTTLLNVRKTTKDKLKVPTGLTIHARTMQFQRGGRQFPEIFLNYNGTETRKPFPENSKQVSIQVDVRKQNITSLFLNHSPIEFTDPVFLNAPTAGVIGVFVLRGKCKFTNAEIRIIREDTP